MSRKVTIKLSGLAEKFMDEMRKQGLSDEDVISQALGLMAEVWKSQTVAKIKPGFRKQDVDAIEYYYLIQTPESFEKRPAEERPSDMAKDQVISPIVEKAKPTYWEEKNTGLEGEAIG